MRKISEASQDVVMRLVGWEMLGADEDPKVLLRQVSLPDLATIQGNSTKNPSAEKSLTEQLVELEVAYRTGRLLDDWKLFRNGAHVSIVANYRGLPVEQALH